MRTEHLILNNLLHDEDYARRTLPYLKPEYFSDRTERIVYEQLDDFINKFNALPSREALTIEIGNLSNINDKDYTSLTEYVSGLVKEEQDDKQWLVDTTEKFCQEKALYNAIMESISIIDGDGKKDKGAIPEILSDALSVSFDPNVGHDFIDNAADRFDFYHKVEERVPFDIQKLNDITKGGVPKKSLNIILAGTGVGKSLAMCHMATANLLDGKNVLYITMEMAEEKIAERIDANILNVTLDDLKQMPRASYEKKMERVKGKTSGKLIVKEYPTAAAGTGHFRHLLNELRLKKSFKPDIIYIDYLNICASSRMKMGASVNSYTYIKAIAEELRGLAVEQQVPIWSATQTTRSGYGNSDVGLEDTSESFGLPATADFMMAIISSEELEQLNQVMVKQLKNRYGDPNYNKRFVVGIDRAKMRLYDVEESAQDDLIDVDGGREDKPLNNFGTREKKDKFSDFNF
jgi:replicative DNA helicase